jgi:hypothetical protein
MKNVRDTSSTLSREILLLYHFFRYFRGYIARAAHMYLLCRRQRDRSYPDMLRNCGWAYRLF